MGFGHYLYDTGELMLDADGNRIYKTNYYYDAEPCPCCLACKSIDNVDVYLPNIPPPHFSFPGIFHDDIDNQWHVGLERILTEDNVSNCYWGRLFSPRSDGRIPKLLLRLEFKPTGLGLSLWFSSRADNVLDANSYDHRFWGFNAGAAPSTPPRPKTDLFVPNQSIFYVGDFGTPPWIFGAASGNAIVTFSRLP